MKKSLIDNLFEDINKSIDTVHPIEGIFNTGVTMRKNDKENKCSAYFLIGM